jgi:hypothetical protein
MTEANRRVGELIDATRKRPIYFNDFLSSTGVTPFAAMAAIASGTFGTANLTDIDHPGILRIQSSTNANSGARIMTDTSSMNFGGGEIFESMIYPGDLTLATIRTGFLDTTSQADATDGAYFEMQEGGLLVAKTASNGTRTTSGTSLQLTTLTWYALRVSPNANASAILYEVFNAARTKLFDVTLATNIPAAARTFGCGTVGTNSGTAALDILHIDYMALAYARSLAR